MRPDTSIDASKSTDHVTRPMEVSHMSETRTIHTLPLEDVYPHPKQYRELDTDHVKRLADSMGSLGQLDPIEVMRDGDIYYVESGHHRVEALKSLEAAHVLAIITNDAPDLAAAKMVAANIARPDSDYEKTRGIQLMLETGVVPEVAAKQVGILPEHAEAARRALKHVDPIAVEEHSLDWLLAIDEFADDSAAVERLAKARENEWRGVYRENKRRRDQAAGVETAKRLLTLAGIPWTLVGDGQKFVVPDGLQSQGSWNYIKADSTSENLRFGEGVRHATIGREPWSSSASVSYYYDKVDADDEMPSEWHIQQEERRAHRERCREMTKRRFAHVLEIVERDGITHPFLAIAADYWHGMSTWGSFIEPIADVEWITDETPLFTELVLTLISALNDETADATEDRSLGECEQVAPFLGTLVSYGYELDEVESALLEEQEEGDDE